MADRSAALEWAVEFGWDLSLPRAVLVAEVESAAGARRPTGEEAAAQRHRLAEAARVTLGRNAIVWERSAEVAALVAPGARGGQGLEEAAAELQADARRRLPGTVVSIGIGRVVEDPLRLRDSHAEARQARAIGRWSRGPGGVARFEALGLDRLLVTAPEAEREAFVAEAVGPLLEHDRRHGTALVQTLERWLADRNGAHAARDLFEALVGPFLEDPDRCLELALAVRLLRLGRGKR